MTSLYITVSAVLPTSSSKDSNICGAPILEFTEESCKNGMGFDQFQVQSSKKINWKKPLNGKIRLKFGGNSGKSDALRLKKCVKVLSSFTQDLIELTAYFQENVPRNEATLVYANETTVLLQLSLDGRVQGMWKKLNFKNQLNDIHHCDFPSYKWRRIAENIEAWEFHSSKKQKWMHSGRFEYFSVTLIRD